MINIGKNIKDESNVEINLNNLISTRLLIQANSGGGKSWLIRKLLEESHGKIQQIIIDLEGEFSTLREKYDYLLVGSDGEIPANIKTAELLAKKLLELNVSTIIDLSELKHHERILFVKRFLDSLISAPKKLWHPCLVIVDEAHQFCPQTSKSESSSSVIDLMTRGRKRGFCGVLATQRISKLHKDACAEANNRLIGRTGLDIDRKRASEELGFTKKEDEISLRHLKAGEFYAFGSSISEEIIKIKVGDVKTTHPEAGKGTLIKSSKTPDNIKKLLKDIINLPKEVDDELKNLSDYKTKVMELKRQVRILETSKPKPEVDGKQIQKAFEQGINKGHQETERDLNKLQFSIKKLLDKINKIHQLSNQEEIDLQLKKGKIGYSLPQPIIKPTILEKPQLNNNKESTNEEYQLNLCEKKIYSLLYQYSERTFSITQVGAFTGYSSTSGGTNNAIYHLRNLGLIEGTKENLKIKDLVSDIMGEFDFSKEAIISKLSKCEKEIYNVLLENSLIEFTKEDLASNTPTQYSHSSGGFNNAIYKLKRLGLIKRNDGMIKLNPELLEL